MDAKGRLFRLARSKTMPNLYRRNVRMMAYCAPVGNYQKYGVEGLAMISDKRETLRKRDIFQCEVCWRYVETKKTYYNHKFRVWECKDCFTEFLRRQWGGEVEG